MPRGFTFIELLISLLVLSVLLAGVAPSFTALHQNYQAKKLASEFMGFFTQARSEAVMRNQNLWIHFATNGSSDKGWVLALRKSDTAVDYNTAANGAVMVTQGEGNEVSFNIGGTPPPSKIRLDGVNGKPVLSGNITFALKGTQNKQLKLKFHNKTGRFIICGIKGEQYGYLKC